MARNSVQPLFDPFMPLGHIILLDITINSLEDLLYYILNTICCICRQIPITEFFQVVCVCKGYLVHNLAYYILPCFDLSKEFLIAIHSCTQKKFSGRCPVFFPSS